MSYAGGIRDQEGQSCSPKESETTLEGEREREKSPHHLLLLLLLFYFFFFLFFPPLVGETRASVMIARIDFSRRQITPSSFVDANAAKGLHRVLGGILTSVYYNTIAGVSPGLTSLEPIAAARAT